MATPSDWTDGYLRGFMTGIKELLDKVETESADKATKEHAKQIFKTVKSHLTNIRHAFSKSREGDLVEAVEKIRERYISVGKKVNADTSDQHTPIAKKAHIAPVGGAASGGGAPSSKASMPNNTATVDQLNALIEVPITIEVIRKIGEWAETNGFKKTPFLNTVYGKFYHLIHDAIKEGNELGVDLKDPQFAEHNIGNAQLRYFVLPAMALAIAEHDRNYREKTLITVGGTQWRYDTFAHLHIAQVSNSNPEGVTKKDIQAYPIAFIQGISMAKEYLDSPIDAVAPSAHAGEPLPTSTPIHGMGNAGNDCWALSLTQFLRHAEGFGTTYLERLRKRPARDALIHILRQYDEGRSDSGMGREVRAGFKASDHLGGISTDFRQHDAQEALTALLSQDMGERELSWTRTRIFQHPMEERYIRNEETNRNPMIDARIPAEGDEMNIPAAVSRLYDDDIDSSVVFSQAPEHFAVALRYESLQSGGQCPFSFVLPGTMIRGEGHPPLAMDLDAAIIHHGEAPASGHYIQGGHYTCVIRKDGRWYHLNDATAHIISEETARHLLTPKEFSRPVAAHFIRIPE